MWKELAQEFPKVFNQCVEQTLWNAARDIELILPLTQMEETRRQKGIPHEQITLRIGSGAKDQTVLY